MEYRNYISAPLECVPQDIILPYPIYVWVNKKMILFRSKGDTLASVRATTLSVKVDTIYINVVDWYQFLSDLEQKVGKINLVKEPEQYSTNVRNLFYAYGKTLELQRELKKETYLKVEELSDGLSKCILLKPEIPGKLLKRFNDTTLYFPNHSLNVGIFCAAIASKLNWKQEKVSNLILIGMFHNVGLLKIPDEIVYKPEKLLSEEWEQIQKHSEIGADILSTLGAPSEVVRAVKDHHEQPDSGGYPKGLMEAEIIDYVSLIAIADVYDALLSHRPWKPPLSPEAAIEMMGKMEGRFNADIFKLLSKKK